MTPLSQSILELYQQQKLNWDFYAKALENLSLVKQKELQIGGDRVVAQYNPARIISTSAAVDSSSLAKRPCFLCPENRPKEQGQVDVLNSSYSILLNPYPVLPRHFTVASLKHAPQTIRSSFADMLEIVALLGSEWLVLYNGALAGASAPDHMHFQLAPSAALPLVTKVNNQSHAGPAAGIVSYAGCNYLLFSDSHLDRLREPLLTALNRLPSEDLINLLAWKNEELFFVVLMPRSKHRPQCYYRDGSDQIMISPAAIELSGVWVTPRHEDFIAVDGNLLGNIATEVCCTYDLVSGLLS